MNTHNTWDNLLKAALLGTERQAPVVAAGDDELSQLLGGLDGERERALLGAAAAITLYERAGLLPGTGTVEPPAPCPTETMPRPRDEVVRRLDELLYNRHRELLEEWLQLAVQKGVRAPEELLPRLMDAAHGNVQIRPLMARVIGQRGHWLGGLNPDWKYFSGQSSASDEETWQTGSTAARLEVLQRQRANAPARARAWLQSTWEQEAPKERADFLATFRTGLNAEDEAFLESALQDRRKEVRTVAAELLSKLPGSRFVARMVERLTPLLAWNPKAKGKARLEVQVPGEFDDAMARDGLEQKPDTSGVKRFGEKASLLRQMIECVPPTYWCHQWNTSPQDILDALHKHDWEELIRESLRVAAQRHQDIAWLELFWKDLLARQQFNAVEIVQALSSEQREAWVLAALPAVENRLSDLQGTLQACDHQWSEGFSRAIINALRDEITNIAIQKKPSYSSNYHYLYGLPVHAALHIPVHLMEEYARNWPEEGPNWATWKNQIEEALIVLELRRAMRREFAL
jgi:hypothetical protein